MGRDYIGERTIADPRERAIEKRRRARAARERRVAEARALAAFKDRIRWCIMGCGEPRQRLEDDWWPGCSEKCHIEWLAKLERKEEVKQARRLGIPVAEFRNSLQSNKQGDSEK